MASRVEQLATAIAANMTAGGSWSTMTTGFGRLASKENATWPRMVWIPTGGPIHMTRHPGMQVRVAGSKQKVLRAAETNFEVMLWGEDHEEAEQLMHDCISATWQETHGNVEFQQHTWETESRKADYAVDGVKITLTLSIRIPVHESTAYTLGIVNYQDHDETLTT